MVHSAYDAVGIVQGSPARIEVAGVHGSKILTGCSDCSLRIYAPAASPLQTPDASGRSAGYGNEIQRDSYVLERTVSGFWKRSPLAMEISMSRDLLLSLSEWIAFHRLPNLETVAAIGKTKGASVYSWDDQRGFLCVGKQKKVGIFRLDGGREFVEVKEFSVPDVAKSMSWCGENICLGIKREYMILNSITGALSEVFPSGRIAPPLVIPLSNGDLILGKDNIGVFVDQNGKLLQDGRICWSEAPVSVIIDRPYAIARLPKYVEIRSLRAPYPLVQTVYLRDAHILLESNGYVIATSVNSVYRLLPVPLDVQIVQLTASGDFEEALALCKLLPPEESALRAAKEGSIHIRYGHSLFNKGNYEEAVDQFLASMVDITYVLSLYPSIILPKTSAIPESDERADLSDSLHLSRASSDASDEVDVSSPDSDDNSTLNAKKMRHNALKALIKYLQKQRYVIIERAITEVTDEVVMGAVQSSSRKPNHLNKARGSHHISSVARERASILDTALLQAMILTGQLTGALEFMKGPNYCDLKICEEFLIEKKCHALLLELYKGYQMHREALKLLVQLVDESSSDASDSTSSQKFMPDMVIEYLKPLCGSDAMLVLEFSMHVLESCPTQTIELFLSENIPSDLVNSYLKQHAPNMQSKYLELMLSMNESVVSPNLQNELVQIYLAEVIDWFKDLKDQHKWEEKLYSPTRKKLLSALEGISPNNAETLLKRLPPNALYEEHAILLGRMNQHQLSLSLYVHKLHLPELALSYCDRVYETSRGSSNIYLTLLQIYLNPRRSTLEFERKSRSLLPPEKPAQIRARNGRGLKKIASIEGSEDVSNTPSSTDSGRSDCDGDDADEEVDHAMLNYALELLTQRWDRINGAQALRLLPRKIKLMNLLPFLEPLLKKSSEFHRNYSIIRSLRYSENLQVKDELLKEQKPRLKIEGDSSCALCRKKIGTSVFVVYPNRKTLVHFVCFRDSQRLRF